MSRHNGNFKNMNLSKADLAEAVSALGWAFCAQHKPPRCAKNVTRTGFLAVDVDQELRIEDAKADPFFQAHAGILYPTASHTPAAHRFRIVFELEEALTEAAEIQAALTGLAYRFKGDKAATDASRVFFGNRGCRVEVYEGNTLPHREVRRLIEFAHERAAAKQFAHKTGAATRVRSRLSIAIDTKVRTASGVEELLWNLSPGTPVYCPNHADQRPSAFIVYSRDGKPGVSCSACLVTLFPDGHAPAVDGYFETDLSAMIAEGKEQEGPLGAARVRVVTERYLSEPDATPERLPQKHAATPEEWT